MPENPPSGQIYRIQSAEYDGIPARGDPEGANQDFMPMQCWM